MRWRQLGRTGLRVPPLCLGTMTFGLQCDEATSFAILDKALDGGIDFIDTADVYPLGGDLSTTGRTEEIVGRWMKARAQPRPDHPGDEVLRRHRRGLERQRPLAIPHPSRRRRQPAAPADGRHRPVPGARLRPARADRGDDAGAGRSRALGEGALRRLLELHRRGGWRKRSSASDRAGVARYDCLQPRYNLLYREIETELLPLCRSQGVGVIVYNPMAGGFLSGKYRKGDDPLEGTRFTLGTAAQRYQERYWQDALFDAVEELRGACESRNVAMATVAVAWAIAQPGVTSAIVGASRPEQLEASLAAPGLELDDGLKAACEAAWWTVPRRPVLEGYR